MADKTAHVVHDNRRDAPLPFRATCPLGNVHGKFGMNPCSLKVWRSASNLLSYFRGWNSSLGGYLISKSPRRLVLPVISESFPGPLTEFRRVDVAVLATLANNLSLNMVLDKINHALESRPMQ